MLQIQWKCKVEPQNASATGEACSINYIIFKMQFSNNKIWVLKYSSDEIFMFQHFVFIKPLEVLLSW